MTHVPRQMNSASFYAACFAVLPCMIKNAPSAIQTAWKPSANANPPGSVAPGTRETTAPVTHAIQISPMRSNPIPPILNANFIFNLTSLSHRLGDEPQSQNRRNAVKAVPEECLCALRAVLGAEHVRHHCDNSGERNQPHNDCRNPPQHF